MSNENTGLVSVNSTKTSGVEPSAAAADSGLEKALNEAKTSIAGALEAKFGLYNEALKNRAVSLPGVLDAIGVSSNGSNWLVAQAEKGAAELRSLIDEMDITLESVGGPALTEIRSGSKGRKLYVKIKDPAKVLAGLARCSFLSKLLAFLDYAERESQHIAALQGKLKTLAEHVALNLSRVDEVDQKLADIREGEKTLLSRREEKRLAKRLESAKVTLDETRKNLSEKEKALDRHLNTLRQAVAEYQWKGIAPAEGTSLSRLYQEIASVLSQTHSISLVAAGSSYRGVEQGPPTKNRFKFFVAALVVLMISAAGVRQVSKTLLGKSRKAAADEARVTLSQDSDSLSGAEAAREALLSIPFFDQYLTGDEKYWLSHQNGPLATRLALLKLVANLDGTRSKKITDVKIGTHAFQGIFRKEGSTFAVYFDPELIAAVDRLFGPTARIGLVFTNADGFAVKEYYVKHSGEKNVPVDISQACTPGLRVDVATTIALPSGINIELNLKRPIQLRTDLQARGYCSVLPTDSLSEVVPKIIESPFLASRLTDAQKGLLLGSVYKPFKDFYKLFFSELGTLDRGRMTRELNYAIGSEMPFSAARVQDEKVLLSIKDDVVARSKKTWDVPQYIGIEYISIAGGASEWETAKSQERTLSLDSKIFCRPTGRARVAVKLLLPLSNSAQISTQYLDLSALRERLGLCSK